MNIIRNIEVPTGNILVGSGDKGQLEFLCHEIKIQFLHTGLTNIGLNTNPLSSRFIKSSLITFLRIFKLPFICIYSYF